VVTASSETHAPDVSKDVSTEEPQGTTPIPHYRLRRGERGIAATIVLCATILSAFWALRFPMFQEPDEIAHSDAAFAYFDAGQPFVVRRPTIANFVMPETRYLMNVTGYRRLRYNNHAAVRGGYGTRAYFRRIDAEAPKPSHVAPGAGARVPYALAFYPSTYYYCVAIAMRAGWAAFGNSLSAAFFAGRFLNVAMLASTLALTYGILLQLSLTSLQRIMLLAGVAFFPLSTWMGAYIQPDNQSALLMMATLLGALALRKRPASLVALACFAIAASALGVTKLQYAIVAILAFAFALRGAFERESPIIRLRALILGIGVPLLAAFLGRYVSPVGGLNAPPSGAQYTHIGLLERLIVASSDIIHSATGTFLGGQTFAGFWFHFGLRSGGVFSPEIIATVTIALTTLTVLTCAAWLAAQLRLFRSLRHIASRFGISRALRFLFNDPFLNLYVLLSALLFAASAFTDGDLMLQGRYWYPVLLPIVVLSVHSFGYAVPRSQRRRATSIACAFWLCYSAIAAPSAVVAMQRDFYHVRDAAPTSELGQIESVAIDGRPTAIANLTIPAGSNLSVSGDAIDTSNGLPATDIRFRVDGGAELRATSRLPDRELVVIFNDQLLANGGFHFEVPTNGLSPGAHEVAIAAYEERAPDGLPIDTLHFSVVGRSTK
jgi:hypothetical protein